MKKLLVLAMFIFAFSTSANALTMSNNSCNPQAGQVYVTVAASAWDVLYHGNVVFKVRNSQLVWRTVSKPMNIGTNTYALSVFQETDLDDVSQYNIGTNKTTVIVSACNN
ncbi:MAG: hypothetical protein Q8K30_05615 [Candidatus Gracilibacteria bacterium]|nr:hypothetical protein [Candidatus Gracilibacteria bacterium]MDP2395384.1 hypothetical protein [bacterium]MDP3381623.1 hypothetical protein [bacterium]